MDDEFAATSLRADCLFLLWIGIDNRTVMDMDTTIKRVPLKEGIVRNIVSEIIYNKGGRQ